MLFSYSFCVLASSSIKNKHNCLLVNVFSCSSNVDAPLAIVILLVYCNKNDQYLMLVKNDMYGNDNSYLI